MTIDGTKIQLQRRNKVVVQKSEIMEKNKKKSKIRKGRKLNVLGFFFGFVFFGHTVGL